MLFTHFLFLLLVVNKLVLVIAHNIAGQNIPQRILLFLTYEVNKTAGHYYKETTKLTTSEFIYF